MKMEMVILLNKVLKVFLLTAAILFVAVSCSIKKESKIIEGTSVKVDESKEVLKIISSYNVIKNLYVINDTLLLIIGNGERSLIVYNRINGKMYSKIEFDEKFERKLYSDLKKEFTDSLKLFNFDKVKQKIGGKIFSFPYFNDISSDKSDFYIRGILYYGLHISNMDLYTVYEYLLKFNVKTLQLSKLIPSFFYLNKDRKGFHKIDVKKVFYLPSFYKQTVPFVVKDDYFYFFTNCDTGFTKSFETLPYFVKINFNNGRYEFLKTKIKRKDCITTGLNRFKCIEYSQFSINDVSNRIYVFIKNNIYNLITGNVIYNISNSKDDIIYNFYISPDEKQVNTLFYSRKGFYYKMFNNGKLTDSLFVGTRDSVYGVDLYKKTGVALIRRGENFYFKNYKFE